ncbi:MAG: dephospho-CoA kinase [Actinomycetota bacterium]|nr:dephospho-CoA kinase [Actinomycetota bacterium]
MRVVGLTGGIGSGKSTFAALLAELGAHVIDADILGRQALHPGEPAWHAVVDTFGDEVLQAGGLDIDRKRLADLVFSDKAKLAALNAITHPVILRSIADSLDRYKNSDDVVVIDAALIVDFGLRDAIDKLIVVGAGEELRRARLKERGMRAQDIDARIAAQKSQDELIAEADIIVTNDGSLETLRAEAERVWTLIGAG